MIPLKVVSRDEWLKARKALLLQEKDFTRQRDRLTQARQALPWVRVEKPYAFESPAGRVSLADLFDGRNQLIVYHFMMGPDWEAGCKSCSFWADNFNGVPQHLTHRDITLVAVSRAPLAKIEAFQRRMGWSFPWVSSFDSDFNFDFGVSYRAEDLAKGPVSHPFTFTATAIDERAGISVFAKGDDGAVYHTYSTYSRGLDMMNGAYQLIDLTPKGRAEEGLPNPQAWVLHHDRYES